MNEDFDFGVIDRDEEVVVEKKSSKNANLTAAKKAKNDEFYTQLSDIEKELSHYDPAIFKDKVIYCPMDVAVTDGAILQSQFVKYFQMNAHRFQYKKLIATCLADKSNMRGINKYIATRRKVAYCTEENQAKSVSPIAEVMGEDGRLYYEYLDGHRLPISPEVVNEIVCDENGVNINSAETWKNQFWVYTDNLKNLDDEDYDDTRQCKADSVYASGDFRSEECRKILEEADIVVTNPPFSLFREVLAWLCNAEKMLQFIILGSQNAITYKEVFPLLKDNIMWLGYTQGAREYETPVYLEDNKSCFERGGKYYVKMGNTCWFTNVDISKRHELLILTKRYYDDPSYFPKYDNYDAINVNKTKDIPEDYFECIGVPITFLDKFCPEQFEIVGLDRYVEGNSTPNKRFRIRERAVCEDSNPEEVVIPLGEKISATQGVNLKDLYEWLRSRYPDFEFDYCSGIMGVPITFMDKFCPEQFEVLCLQAGNSRVSVDKSTLDYVGYKLDGRDRGGAGLVGGKLCYARCLLKRL